MDRPPTSPMRPSPPRRRTRPVGPPPGSPEDKSPVLDQVLRWVGVLGALAVTGGLLWYFSTLVLYLAIGGLFAYLMKPLVDRIQGLGVGRILSILVAVLLVVGGLTVLVVAVVPFVATEVVEVSQQITADTIVEVAEDVEAQVRRVLPIPERAMTEGLRNAFDTLFQEERIRQMASSMVNLFANLFYAVIVIPFVTFFFLKDGQHIRRAVLRLVPNTYFEVTLTIAEKVEDTLGRYFRALLLQCVSVAVVATVLLSFAGLESAVAVGIFTGLANTIPYFGPLMGFLAGSLVGIAQTGDFSLTMNIFLAMAGTQMSDNILFQPYIFSRAARMHPLLILFVVLVGAQVAAIVGMLIAIPLLTVLRVIVREVLWSWRTYRILRLS